jgi:hypothetical protein
VTRIELLPGEIAFIEHAVGTFDMSAPENLRWQLRYVRQHRALPVYLGWTETIALRSDGTLLRWSTEDDSPGARELDDASWMTAALVQASRRYPELSRLFPARPADAVTCGQCNGTGSLDLSAEHADILCACGGAGWLRRAGP